MHKRSHCWLCGTKLTEAMEDYTESTMLCPECAMDAEDFGIDDKDLEGYELFG